MRGASLRVTSVLSLLISERRREEASIFTSVIDVKKYREKPLVLFSLEFKDFGCWWWSGEAEVTKKMSSQWREEKNNNSVCLFVTAHSLHLSSVNYILKWLKAHNWYHSLEDSLNKSTLHNSDENSRKSQKVDPHLLQAACRHSINQPNSSEISVQESSDYALIQCKRGTRSGKQTLKMTFTTETSSRVSHPLDNKSVSDPGMAVHRCEALCFWRCSYICLPLSSKWWYSPVAWHWVKCHALFICLSGDTMSTFHNESVCRLQTCISNFAWLN